VSEGFIGSGWGFPVRTDATGRIALVSGEQDIDESIRLILATAPGERPMRPEFGCGIHDLAFSSVSASTTGRIAHEVRQSLIRWEPRIDVHDVDVVPESEDPSRLSIEIHYSVRTTNDPRNLVVPYYLLPGEGSSAAGARAPSARGA
jgi:uncharacterized protein